MATFEDDQKPILLSFGEKTLNIAVIGFCSSPSAWLEAFTQEPDNDKAFYSYGLLHAGNGAVQALLASRLGASVALVARTSSTNVTQTCLKTLKHFGVNVDYVVPCASCNSVDDQPQGVSNSNNALDCAHMSAQDILAAEQLLKRAQVVIVNYEIGVHATLQALTICRDKVTILYASPLPNKHCEIVFKMTNFVVINGQLDLFHELKSGFQNNQSQMSKVNDFSYIPDDSNGNPDASNDIPNDSNKITHLVNYMSHLGSANILLTWNAEIKVIAGKGLQIKSESDANDTTNEAQWISRSVSTLAFTDLPKNGEGSESIASLAIVIVHCLKNWKLHTLEKIARCVNSVVQICRRDRYFGVQALVNNSLSNEINELVCN